MSRPRKLTIFIATASVSTIAIWTVEDPETIETILSVGILLPTIVTGLVLTSSFSSKAFKLGKAAVNMYNSGLRNLPKFPQPIMRAGLLGNGIGVKINF